MEKDVSFNNEQTRKVPAKASMNNSNVSKHEKEVTEARLR